MTAFQPQELKTYRGNCHCGGFVYEVDLPEIKTVVQCNCSFCSKKGHLMAFPGDKGNFRVVKGSEDNLVSYAFGKKERVHKFCPICATPVLSRMPDGPPHMKLVLNVRALQGVDVWSLERKHYDGAALGSPYEMAAHKGDVPATDVEDAKLYTGSCHCGALTLAFKSKPIDDTYTDIVTQCNCSVCIRNAYVWVFPHKDQHVLSGSEEDIGYYTWGTHAVAKSFCKICGVNMTQKVNFLSQEKRDTMGPVLQEKYAWYWDNQIHPVNIRALSGVDAEKLKTRFFEGATLMDQEYPHP
ncbi:hypothetical protein PT974_03653 [Cladobotryum mycophilum]|uniref:CENP-V/GFA domain-containing protein n=1 Tax=Cladobotryum mycophilum TaxID=491253 RepID=A0ABR0STA1_9HYPO